MNFSRVQWNVDIKDNAYVKRTDENGNVLPEDNWVWAPTGVINIHYPELWSFVFFSEDRDNVPCDTTIPEDEYRKWELRKLYYAEKFCLRQPVLTATNWMFCWRRCLPMRRMTATKP